MLNGLRKSKKKLAELGFCQLEKKGGISALGGKGVNPVKQQFS